MKAKWTLMLFMLISVLIIAPVSYAHDFDSDILAENNATANVNEYYLDSNADVDGNGSFDSPYKYLTDNIIKNNSVFYFANGNYSFTQSGTYENVSFIGSEVSKTNIQVNGCMVCNEQVSLKNVSFISSQLVIRGTLYSSNTIFKDSTAGKTDSYSNSYGGAIYVPKNTKTTYEVHVDNCTFINNTAQYGGAIFMYGGILDINNSVFVSNYAYNYGGAIACESKSKVTIKNSNFTASISVNDAGGAIYLKSANFEADCLNISDSNATFGAALTLLNTSSNLKNIYLFNNTARYDGGAVYHVLGNLTISKSSFIKNNANNGAGLYVGRCANVDVNDCLFKDNHALSIAGAFFSILNTNITTDQIIYQNNTALANDDFYNAQDLNLFISNINYTLYSHNSTFDGQLPSKFRLDEIIIKDQQDGGNCWAFAALASLEYCIYKASGESIILSEENMKNIIALYSDYGWWMDTNYGGYVDMSVGYLVSWLGPVLQSDDLYDGQSVLSPVLNSITHVQNIKYLKRNSYTDNDDFKRALMDYGGIYTSIYMLGRTNQYYRGGSSPNHAICIVGWDDDYYISGAPGRGAWICKNSWGNWGDKGYFYVSYYDVSCAIVGYADASYVFIFNDTLKYDKNYQYDIPGKTDYFLNSTSTVWYKNKFTSTDNEYLAAVSTYFNKDTNWDLSILVNNVLKSTKSGFSNPGYYTIELDDFIPLNPDDVFEVIFKIGVDGDAGVPISESQSLAHQFYKENISFISYDGINWVDFYDLKWEYPGHTYKSQVACIKAFTILDSVNTTLSLNVFDDIDGLNVTALVLNQYGKIVHGGKVTLNVNGVDYVVDVDEGFANTKIEACIGLNNVSAQYDAVGFISSSKSTSIDISKFKVKMDLNISKNLDDVELKIIFSKPINETVIITVANHTYTLNSKNGTANLKLKNQTLGKHDVNVRLQSEIYIASEINSDFTITPLKTRMESDNVEAIFGNENLLKVKLLDENSNPLPNQNITYTLDSKDYTNTTDDSGFIYIDTNLAVGTYILNIRFNGAKMYYNSSATGKITIKSSIGLPSLSTYTYNSTYKASFLDKSGNTLSGNVAYVINGIRYNVNAGAGVNVVLNPGSYIISVINPATGEVKNQTVNVVKRIQENNDLITYYGSENHFKVKVLDDNGNVAEGMAVAFNVGGKSYVGTTDSSGYAYLNILLNPNTYTVTTSFKGFSVKNTWTVKSTVTLPSSTVYTYNSVYKASFLDKSGNSLSGNVAYVINGVRHEVGADNGVSVVLGPGSYAVSVINLATGEVKNQTVNVVKRIQENNDLIKYYGAGNPFKVKVLDDNGNAAGNVKVTFTIDGKSYSVTTDGSGYASLNINLLPNVYTVTVTYKGFSVNNAVTVKSTVSLPSNTVYTYNSLYKASFLDKSGNKLSSNVAYVINGVRHEVGADNGVSVVLDPGSYAVSVINLATGEVKNQTVNVVKRIQENNDLITYYNSGDSFKVKVLDDNGNAASNVKVTFTANGKTYSSTTDGNGYAFLNLDLTQEAYNITASYKGFSVENKIAVKSTIGLPTSTVYTYNSIYRANFLDKSGNKLSGNVAYVLNGIRNEVSADNGVSVILNPGTYTVSVINLATGEVKNQTVNVVKRLQDNNDLTVYYGSDNHFKVKVLDDKGNAASNVKVAFTIGGKSYSVTTDASGYASLDVIVDPGVYTVTATYKGFSVKNTLNVKSTVSLPSNTVYTYNSIYKASFLDKSGNSLSGKVAYVINDVRYEVGADNGVSVVLSPGRYGVSVINLATGEVKNQTVRVVERISENNDLTTYYNSGDSIKVRVFDDNGNAASNVKVTFTANGQSYSRLTDANGYVSLDVSLPVGVYTVTAAYKGFSVKNTLTVKSTIDLPAANVYTYNSTYKAGFLDKSGNKFTGKVAITLNGVRYEANANDGINILLNSGNYVVNVLNLETGEVKTQAIQVVNRIQDNSDLTVYYGSDNRYNVKVFDDNGNAARNVKVAFTANGQSYSASTDSNGYVSLDVSLPVGVYTVTAAYKGFSVKNTLTVKSTIDLPAANVYTYNSTYKASFLDKSGKKFSGKVAITINGIRYEVNAADGVNVVLNPGNYSVNVLNLETGEVKTQYIKVVKRIQDNSDLTVYYGSDNRFKVRILDDNGNAARNVKVTFALNGQSYSSTTDNNGYASLNIDVPANVYTVTTSYKGFSVKNKMTIITTIALPTNTTYMCNYSYKATFLDKSGNGWSGNVAYLLNGVRYEVNANDSITLDVGPDSYVVSVINIATGEVKNQSIEVIGKITENEDLVTYYESGDSYTVKILDDNMEAAKNVNVTFTINNQTYSTTTDDEGYASIDINLPSDVYNITTSYDDFTVNDVVVVKSTIVLPTSNVYTYNSTYRAGFLDKSGNEFLGKVAITLNGVRYNVNAGECISILLNPGSYIVYLENLLTGEVTNQTIEVVERIQENSDLVTYYNSGDSFKVRVLDDNGNAACNVKVSFTVNGKNYSVMTDNDGYAALNLDLTRESYDITASYKGFSVKNKITVKSTVDLPSEGVYTYNSVYKASFLDKSGNKFAGNVAYVLDGVRYEVNANDGVNIALSPGNHVVSVVNLVNGEVKNQTIAVVERICENGDLVTYYNSGDSFKVRVLDDNGNAARNVKVSFTANGKNYSAITDNGGYASLNLDLTSESYDITASYKGFSVKNKITVKSTVALPSNSVSTYNSVYTVSFLDKTGSKLSGNVAFIIDGIKSEVAANNGIASINLNPGIHNISVINSKTGEVKNQTIEILSKIQDNKNITMYYGAGKYYKVKILDNNGNVAKNVSVTFKLNGKTYIRYTNENGIASLKINQKAKTYTITATLGDFSVENKIVVKPTLIAKNMAVKKGKTFKYTVKLLNKKGKILKKKYVKVTFKGRTYNVKTNSKGIATFKIKVNSKLGKYTITSSYGSVKVSKKITVKK